MTAGNLTIVFTFKLAEREIGKEKNAFFPLQSAFLEFLYNTSTLITLVRMLLLGKEGQEMQYSNVYCCCCCRFSPV